MPMTTCGWKPPRSSAKSPQATSSFFLGSESIVPTAGYGMPMWRDWIFMMMKRNSGDVVSYLNLPHDRVIELKSQHIV